MPKSRKFRKNSIDFKIEFPHPRPDPIREALIKAKRDVPFTELRKFLPKPKPMVFYRQKNHGKYREPSIVILNQKIQGRSRKMGRRPSIGKHKKTRRNRTKKYRRGMMGGVTDPTTPREGYNEVEIPQPKTPTNSKTVIQQVISPTVKNKKEDENEYVPVALFHNDD